MRTWRRSATLATGILVAAGGLVTVGPALAAAVSPSFVAGNPSCADLGLGSLEVKFDPPTSGTMDLGPLDTVTMTTADGIYLDWSATLGIDAVIVKGGPNANVYAYSPEATADTGLSSPINPSNGTPYAISHVSFCYDFELDVAKTANTSLERTWTWDIDKVGDQTALTLQTGQTHLVNYDVTLTAVPADSDWTVSGTVTIAN
ncbi:MAG: hypothetical protein H5T80_10565, partial [Dietzia sp.]|nr:hypothetical protein [Dietzia sp.]